MNLDIIQPKKHTNKININILTTMIITGTNTIATNMQNTTPNIIKNLFILYKFYLFNKLISTELAK